MSSKYDPRDYIQRHLQRQEICEASRNEEADTLLHELRSDYYWAAKRCSELLELKPAEEEQIDPAQVFGLFEALNSNLQQVKQLAEIIGCKITLTYEIHNEIGAKNKGVATNGFDELDS